ncbi:MAG TPA: hypothetical protein VGB11_03005 [Candidatus Bathyarchaeia archaeon]|jgi:hypothetical protein
MVKKRFLLIALSVTLVCTTFLSATAQAWTGTYHLEHEWVKIWINQDGSIDLLYDIQLMLDSGDSISKVFVGQPKRDFTIGAAIDEYDNTMAVSDASSGSDYKVQVTLSWALAVRESVKFNLITNVAGMLYNDTTNPGNIGMQFIPSWYEAPVNDLRIQIVLPPNVTASEVKTTQTYWNNTANEDGSLTVYWEKQNLTPNEQYPIGISFPAEYLPNYEPQPPPTEDTFGTYAFVAIGAVVVILAIIVVVFVARKKPYTTPQLSMETLGIKRGLTAVEASYLLEIKPTQVVTEILYSLLQKRAVWTEATNPALKLRVMPDFKDKTGTAENPLRYYEIDFFHAVKSDGTLDEEKLAHTVMYLRDTVEQKLRGYSRKDTVDYYRKIVAKAWTQVEQAGTADIASNAYDEQLLWLLLDPNYRARTETAFHNRIFEPNPLWLWYWHGYHHNHPHPTYTPPIGTSAPTAKPPAIPGAEFANNIATAVEKTSSNIVLNIEKFANAILPAPPPTKASHEPARHGAECVCACHACACACACVSCACACAGGGVG